MTVIRGSDSCNIHTDTKSGTKYLWDTCNVFLADLPKRITGCDVIKYSKWPPCVIYIIVRIGGTRFFLFSASLVRGIILFFHFHFFVQGQIQGQYDRNIEEKGLVPKTSG